MRATILSSPEVKKSRLPFLGLVALCLLAFPEFAAASGGITEFSSPLEQVVNTITGSSPKSRKTYGTRPQVGNCSFHKAQSSSAPMIPA